MAKISEAEFDGIVTGILEDRATIVKHNPIGSEPEILLWMVMSCLVSYLSLEPTETPCFTGRPDVKVYRDAIDFILRGRKTAEFDLEPYLDRLTASNLPR